MSSPGLCGPGQTPQYLVLDRVAGVEGKCLGAGDMGLV